MFRRQACRLPRAFFQTAACPRPAHLALRKYATKPSLLSHSLDQNSAAQDRFQLGFAVGQTQSARGEKPAPQWKELSNAGKVNRTVAQSSNLGVILIGAGLTGLLFYALLTDLFSPNSPSVLYDDACQRILASPKLARYLDGTTPRFHLDPPSVVRPRHRNRHVNSSLRVDAAGREHIYLNFYLQSRPESPSWVDRATTWTQDKVYLLSELSWDQLLDRSRQSLSVAWAKTHELARYLSGAPSVPPIPPPTDTTKPAATEESTSYFGSMFSSLRRPRGRTFESKPEVEAHGQFNEGEVHVAYVKNNAGEFVLRYILVELPNSKVKNPVRVFVERAPGVRDTEAVMHWSSAH